MKFLSVKEVAAMLGVTRQTVWILYKQGKFPRAQVIGHQIAIPLVAAEQYQKLQKEAS